MANGYWERDERGNYHWKEYGSGVLAVIVILVILAIIVNNVDMGSSSSNNASSYEYVSNHGDGNNDGGNSGGASTSKKLTDLRVLGDHSSVVDNIRNGNVEDAYGNSYQGPYLDLYSYGNYGGVDYVTQAYTEFVAGGNYSYLSGTFFARGDQEDSYNIELLIFADDKLIYSSGKINRKTKAIDFNVDISGCDVIRVQSRSTDWSDFNAGPSMVVVDAVVYN